MCLDRLADRQTDRQTKMHTHTHTHNSLTVIVHNGHLCDTARSEGNIDIVNCDRQLYSKPLGFLENCIVYYGNDEWQHRNIGEELQRLYSSIVIFSS